MIESIPPVDRTGGILYNSREVNSALKKIIRYISVLLCVTLMLCGMTVAVSAESEYPGDPMVYLTQVWLNQQYGGVTGFGFVTENGKTGYDTVNGLLRALQHELGITELANSFGPSTTERYSQNILSRNDGAHNRMYAILQGALWCKGYNPGYKVYMKEDGAVVYDDVFDDTVENAVINLKTDMGFVSPDGTVTLDVMKALMSMDYFKNVGDIGIYQLQQSLNREYGDYIGIIACDGVYSRRTQIALIKCLQAVEGLSPAEATGNFGAKTRELCPDIPYTSSAKKNDGTFYSEEDIAKACEILGFALVANGYGASDISAFQQDMALEVTGRADVSTWMSLLISHGDPTRPAIAADCMTKLDSEKAKALYDSGYRYIGRYLTVESKAITKEEAQSIFDAGLRFFPIYQTSADKYGYFTAQKGAEDAKSAIDAAKSLGLPTGTVIYFAVDFDATDIQITNAVLPYFESISKGMAGSGYRVGVYGTRNVCTRVSDKGYAEFSFVSNISSGYSGNLGFKMPSNWAFDQFATVSLGSFAIDKNGYSGKDACVGELVPYVDTSAVFSDIKAKGWYKQYVDYAVAYGIFTGTSKTTFSPNDNITRAQFVQVLANLEGVDTSNRDVTTGFSDVPAKKWFTSAVKWASDNKIVNGVGEGRFDPNANVTREQMCVMLVNYARFKSIALKTVEDKESFADDASISKWARTAVYTCQQSDIVNGKGEGKFDPQGTGTRAEASVIFTKFHKEYPVK